MSLHLIIFDRGSLEVAEHLQLRQAKKKAPMIKWDMKICLFDLADESIRRESVGVIGDILFVGTSTLSYELRKEVTMQRGFPLLSVKGLA